jgi:hypothetical protein
MNPKKVVAAGGVSVALIVAIWAQIAMNEKAAAEEHARFRERLAIIETRFEYRLGLPGPEEAGVAEAAAQAEKP